MKIECPACAHKQTFAITASCGNCNGILSGHLYRKYRKPFLSATTALVLGAYGSYKVTDNLHDESRYPLRVEYALVDACVNANARPLPSQSYQRKQEICLCALEETIKEVTYREMRKNHEAFLTSMKSRVEACP